MSTYNPAILGLVNGNAFNGAQVDTAFDDLSTAINGAVDATSNVVDNNILPYNAFHRGAVTETWTASSRGLPDDAFCVIMVDPASVPPQLYWGPNQNHYAVQDTGVDFYLRETATVRFEGCCELLKGKDSWNRPVATYASSWTTTPTDVAYYFTINLIVDGTKRRSLDWSYVPADVDPWFEKRGFPMDITWTLAGMAAGKHTAYLELDVSPNWNENQWRVTYGNYMPMLTQFSSKSRQLSVHAIYR